MPTTTDQLIAIVGIGGIFPSCQNLDEFWQLIRAGKSAARTPPPGRWLLDPDSAHNPKHGVPDKIVSTRACFVDDFAVDPADDFLARLDPMYHLALYAARAARRDISSGKLERARTSVILASIALPTQSSSAIADATLGPQIEQAALDAAIKAGFAPQSGRSRLSGKATPTTSDTLSGPNPLNRNVTGLPALLVASDLSLRGGAFTLDAACASSLYAIKLAVDELRAGRAEAVFAGGLSRPDSLYTQMGFSQLRALSPSGRCAPFDSRADGLVVGEGAGFVVLKRLETALADGDKIHGVIHGVALSNDVGGNLMLPDSEGQLRAMRQAYASAGWSTRDADHIECHGTGTPIGDGVEFESLRQLFGDDDGNKKPAAGRTVLGSVKSNVGHLLTAAGIAGLIKTLLALRHDTLPPTANFESAAPGLRIDDSPFTVLNAAQPWLPRAKNQPRRAAISAFGFGGINAHLLLEEFLTTTPVTKKTHVPAKRPAIAIVAVEARQGDAHGNELHPQQLLALADGEFTNNTIHSLTLRPTRYRIPPRELEEMLPQQLLMLDLATRAWERATGPQSTHHASHNRTGVYIGVQLDPNTANYHLRWRIESQARELAESLNLNLTEDELARYTAELKQAFHPALNANRTMGALGGLTASRIARALHIGGPSFTLSSEHTSGLHALDAAVRAMQQNELDSAIVGAVDFAAYLSFCEIFTADGAAAFVLQRVEDAERDGRPILAIIRGIGHAGGSVSPKLALARAFTDAHNEKAFDPQLISHLHLDLQGGGVDKIRKAALDNNLTNTDHPRATTLTLSSTDHIAEAGSAAASISLAQLVLALHHHIRPPANPEFETATLPQILPGTTFSSEPQYWLHNRADGPRLALTISTTGNAATAILLEEPTSNACGLARASSNPTPTQTTHSAPTPNSNASGLADTSPTPTNPRATNPSPLPAPTESLFILESPTLLDLHHLAQTLHTRATQNRELPLASLAHRWLADHPLQPTHNHALALVPDSIPQLLSLLDTVLAALPHDPQKLVTTARGTNARIFFTPDPLALQTPAKLAFVFPGSGNHFFGMGRELLAHFPHILDQQDAENLRLADQFAQGLFWSDRATAAAPDQKAFIFSQVALGTMLHDVVASLAIKPDAIIGYSLGETAGLFSTHAWIARDEMLERMTASRLFTHALAGPCTAARKTWGLSDADPLVWSLGVVDRPAAAIRAALRGRSRVYLLIINTPTECVIGGDSREVAKLVADLACNFHPIEGVTTVHCDVARQVEKPYRDLHLFHTTPPKDVAFYSGIVGKAYNVTRDAAADSVVGQALDTVDFTRVIEQAYADGVRLFIEIGPGQSCTRMIAQTLGSKPHMARALCSPQLDGPASLLRLAAHLIAHRVPIDVSPIFTAWPDPLAQTNDPAEHTLTLPVGLPPLHMPAPPVHRAPPITQSGRSRLSGPATNAPPSTPPATAAPTPRAPATAENFVPPEPDLQPAQRAGLFITNTVAVTHARAAAHDAYLRMAASTQSALAQTLANQIALLAALSPDDASGLAPTPTPDQILPQQPQTPALFPYESCLEFAVGSIAKMLGPDFALADTFPTRVRLPDEPLMLAHRIMELEGVPLSLTHGRVVTEHDIADNAWYLDGNRIPTCIAVEAGQADLFLSGYLGIDFVTRGLAMYRLLDAVVTFHRGLPGPGATIRYDIHIDRFFQQGSTHLFRFRFEATVDGEPLLSMSDGIAGFFKPEQLAEGKGVIHTALDLRPLPGKRPADWRTLAPFTKTESYNDAQIDALRRGDLAAAFGDAFAGLTLHENLRLPSGRMTLVHRIESIAPNAGRFSLGQIRGEADIHPNDWFLTCHFVDDQVMPGTLMYECCMHTLRVHLLRMGWLVTPGHVSADGSVVGCEPVPGVRSTLKCRGQVIASTKKVTYQITIKELGYNPSPYVIADALMFADGKPIVEILDMSLQMTGVTREDVEKAWRLPPSPLEGEGRGEGYQTNSDRSDRANTQAPKAPATNIQSTTSLPAGHPSPQPSPSRGEGAEPRPPIDGFDTARILAYAVGKPSEAFGEPYRIFDEGRIIARLPGPPYMFVDRIVDLQNCKPFQLEAGGSVTAQYDVPSDGDGAWYFHADRQRTMPFAVLLEIALQPCGWLAAYLGSALTSPIDISFRNLGGSGTQFLPVTPETSGGGTLTTTVKITRVSSSGGMIIQNYDLLVRSREGIVYKGDTYFGFFTKQALANQVGVRDAKSITPSEHELVNAEQFDMPDIAPFPTPGIRMIDRIDAFAPTAGPKKLGYIRGSKAVDPSEWFFKAHFYQDPVVPGSLGLESMIQLMKIAAVRRWPTARGEFQATAINRPHKWSYRGQVIPMNKRVTTEALITGVDDATQTLTADGFLSVDGRVIYQMNGFTISVK